MTRAVCFRFFRIFLGGGWGGMIVFSSCMQQFPEFFRIFQRHIKVENAFALALLLFLHPAFAQTIKPELAITSFKIEKC